MSGYEHSHLWNDMPYEARVRLMPFMIQTHILHLTQTRAKIAEGHEATMRDIDRQIGHLRASLKSELAAVDPFPTAPKAGGRELL